jgi:hypothetical protein
VRHCHHTVTVRLRVPMYQYMRYDRTDKKGVICNTIARPDWGFWYNRTKALNFSRIYRFEMRYDIMLDRYAPVPFKQIKRYDRTNKKGVICGTIVRPKRGFWYDRTKKKGVICEKPSTTCVHRVHAFLLLAFLALICSRMIL